MNSRRMYYGMITLLFLLVLTTFSTVIVGNDYLKKQSEKLVAVKIDQQSLNEQQTALIKAKKDLQRYQDLGQVVKTIVPQDKDQARSVREIVGLAEESQVELSNIRFDSSNLGIRSAPSSTQNNEGSTNDQSNSQTATPNSPITQAKPVSGIKGVYSVEINIDSKKEINSYNNLVTFLSKLENNRRTAQVTQVKILPGSKYGREFIDFSLRLVIYVKP